MTTTEDTLLAAIKRAIANGASGDELLDAITCCPKPDNKPPSNVLDVIIIYDKEYDYVVGNDAEEAGTIYDEQIGGSDERRSIHLKVTVPPWKAQAYTLTVPEQPAGEPVQVEVLPKL